MSDTREGEYGRTYEAQARIISKLHEQIKFQQQDYRQLEARQQALIHDAMFYRVMIEAIQKHSTLQDEWTSFVSLLRLCEPNLENQMKKNIKD